jgi:phage/plasmid-associated DNA primase
MINTLKDGWAIMLNKDTRLEDLLNVLPQNRDVFELIVEQTKETFKVDSKESFIHYVRGCAIDYKRHKIIVTGNIKMKFTADDVINILSQYKLVKLRALPITSTRSDISYWTKDYDDTLGMYVKANIDELTNIIYEELQLKNFNAIISHVNARLSKMSPYMYKFELLNEPEEELILTNNGLLNTKTYNFTTNQKTIAQFDFVSKLDYRILHPSQVDETMYEINNRIFSDWADHDDKKLLYLKQVGLAVLDGDGRGVYHIIIASGGNGKSSYLNILEKLAGNYYVRLNMEEISDDNKLIKLNNTTKLILGHELETKSKFASNTISRLKQLISGDYIKINVKYKDARDVCNTGVKIQATNTLPKIFENTEAIMRRIKIFEWSDINYSKLDTKLDLHGMIQKPEFIEATLALLFTGTEVFKEFVQIDSVDKATQDVVNDSDQVYQFLEWLKSSGLLVGTYTTSIFYEMYKYWNKVENGNIKPLKKRELTERLKRINFDINISSENIRLSSLSDKDINIDVLNKYFFNNEIKYSRYAMSNKITCSNTISDDDIKAFEDRMLESDSINEYKDLLMLHSLVNDMDVTAIAIKALLDDNEKW